MTPEEEAAFKAEFAAMKAKLDSKAVDPAIIAKLDSVNQAISKIEKDKADKENIELGSLRKKFSEMANVKLDSLTEWTAVELKRAIAVEEERPKLDSAQFPEGDDALVPKFDGKTFLPWQARVNWTNAKYPEPVWRQ
jgi:hypothetical protein